MPPQAVNEPTPVIRVRSFDEPLGTQALAQLNPSLPKFLQTQRWFRSKAKTIAQTMVEDVVAMKVPRTYSTIVKVRYTDGEDDVYLLPVAVSHPDSASPDAAEVIADLRDAEGNTRQLYNALSSEEFRNSLLDATSCDEAFEGENGQIITSRTNALDRQCGQWVPELKSKVSRAEQSNSSILFGEQYILKMFRKLETGINPDIEIGKVLTEKGFAYTPPVLGEIIYRKRNGEESHAGILQGFVANKGDAWKYTLESLSGFFNRALSKGEPPKLPSSDAFNLTTHDVPSFATEVIQEYLASAKLLGKRTAQMHAALSSVESKPDFTPEPYTPAYARVLYGEMLHEADRAFQLLREKGSSLPEPAADAAHKLVAAETSIRNRFAMLRDRPVTAARIRHHGDYHLGQLLYTGTDFVIIDFEGEPARPLAARRAKTLAMRDVAGMIRSFSYAAHAALHGQVTGVPTDSSQRGKVEDWAAFWEGWVSSEFLKSYFEEADGASFNSNDAAEQKLLFDAFVLQKALYEVSYELNNRPDWVNIPLSGILALIA